MKKIGLAVVTYKDNFGSALQTYATQYIVDKLGYESECITTDGIQNIIDSNKKKFYLKRIFNKEEFKYIFSRFFSRFKRKHDSTYSKNVKIRHKEYIKFYDNYLKFSKKVHTFKELSEMCENYSAVIVGSDQLWRPSNIAGKYFTLEFVPDHINKIAYSTSFGVAELPKIVRKHAKIFLSRINYISVRENSGKTIVKNIIDKDIPVVCDPTMLLTRSEWDNIIDSEPFAKNDYILVYIMGNNDIHREFVKKLRNKTGYRVIGLLHGSTYIPKDEEWVDEKPFNVGPTDFINLIKNAKYVCTDSFHCCVFSILNHSNFFAFERDGNNKQTSANDRIYTLLSHVGLENRLFKGSEAIENNVIKDINYSSVDEKIDNLRNDSLNYLKRALGDKDA